MDDLVSRIREAATAKGWDLDHLLDERFVQNVLDHPDLRPEVWAAHLQSVERLGFLYRKLAG
jgi:hypothetical protein